MQDSLVFESYPTHPLGAHESWPITGPIYGIAEFDDEPEQSRTFWQRLVANVYDIPANMANLPSNSPIWY